MGGLAEREASGTFQPIEDVSLCKYLVHLRELGSKEEYGYISITNLLLIRRIPKGIPETRSNNIPYFAQAIVSGHAIILC